MPSRKLCNDVERESAKPIPDLASGFFCYVPLHNFRYGIGLQAHLRQSVLKSRVLFVRMCVEILIGLWFLLLVCPVEGVSVLGQVAEEPERRSRTQLYLVCRFALRSDR